MNIGVYGGTFNPLHNGHIALAKAFLSQARLDEVWFVVSPQNPFKANDILLDDNLRLLMVKEALKDEQRLMACDVEFGLPKPSYMYLTLRHLREKYPDYSFTLLIGGDNWAAFDRWRNADEIIRNHSIAIYPREGDDIDTSSLPPNAMLLQVPLLNISSTEVRRRVHDHQPIDNLVPPSVARIIAERGCYL